MEIFWLFKCLFLFFWLHSIWDLSSLTRGQTHVETMEVFVSRWVSKEEGEGVVCVCVWILFSQKEEGYPAICNNMDGPRKRYSDWNKSDAERQMLHIT